MVERTKISPRSNRIAVDLKDLKEPWNAWCKARGLTPSEAVRRVLGVVLNGQPSELPPHPADYPVKGEDGRRRVEIRVSPAEHMALTAAADREGTSAPRWLTALVRTHLTGEQHLARDEVEALARSSQLLLALGRNINQIAYNMNQRVDKDELTLAQIEYVSTFLKEHTQAVAVLLHANSKRWRR